MTESHNKKTSESVRASATGGYWQSRFQGLLQVGAGNMFASSILAGLVIGFALDSWLATAPVFMLIFGALGFVGGMRSARKSLLTVGHDSQGQDSNRP